MNNTELTTFEVLQSKDEQRVLDLCRDIYLEMGWRIRFLEPSIVEAFNQTGDLFLVVKQNGEIVGCGGIQRLSKEEALMKKVYLVKHARGTGIASKLFGELVARARAMGYSTILLDVSANNERAIHFYQKQNMEEFVAVPHPRWGESQPEEQKTHRYFRLAL